MLGLFLLSGPAFAVRIRSRLAQAYSFLELGHLSYRLLFPPGLEGQLAPDPFILAVRLYLGLLDATSLREKQARLNTRILTFCGLRGQLLRVMRIVIPGLDLNTVVQ